MFPTRTSGLWPLRINLALFEDINRFSTLHTISKLAHKDSKSLCRGRPCCLSRRPRPERCHVQIVAAILRLHLAIVTTPEGNLGGVACCR